MIPPSYRDRNVWSWSDPVVVPSNPCGRAARAMHDFFPKNLRNPARGRRAIAMRQFPTGQVYSIEFLLYSATAGAYEAQVLDQHPLKTFLYSTRVPS